MTPETPKPTPAGTFQCDALLSDNPAIGTCSSDRVDIWHGMDTPAKACGRHATYDLTACFIGHRNRVLA